MKRRTLITAAASWGVAGVCLAATPAMASTSVVTPSPDAAGSCDTGSLPAVVSGQPHQLAAGGAAGDYVWHDGHGWHVAVTHANTSRMVFTGTITASRPITFSRVRDERSDKTVLSRDHKTLTFRFENFGRLDGVDFGADCAHTVRFAFRVDGRAVPRTAVYLGQAGRHPTSNPFAVERA
jgi:hypothetical protein